MAPRSRTRGARPGRGTLRASERGPCRAPHRVEQIRGAMERQPVFNRVRARLDRPARPGKALRVRGHPSTHPVCLIDDCRHLLECHLCRLGILAENGPGAGRHELDVVGTSTDLLAHRLAHLPGSVGLAVHRSEDHAAGRRRRHDPPAGQDARARNDAQVDGKLQRARFVIVATDVADRRESGLDDPFARRGEDVVPEPRWSWRPPWSCGGGPKPGLRSVLDST